MPAAVVPSICGCHVPSRTNDCASKTAIVVPSNTYNRCWFGLTATDFGAPPTVTVATRVRVVVSITEIVPDTWLTAKTRVPSGDAARVWALNAQHPTSSGIVVTRAPVETSITASDCEAFGDVGFFCSST